MKQFLRAAALFAGLIGSALFGLAMAAPPTVVPSPGYDARLQEQRAAQAAQSARPVYDPAPRRKPRAHRNVPR